MPPLHVLRALLIALASCVAVQASAEGQYNGKDGPMSLRDIDWYGPKGSGQACWWERDRQGKPSVRHCGTLEPRLCGSTAGWVLGATPRVQCNPAQGRICLPTILNETESALNSSIGNASCVDMPIPTVYRVDLAQTMSAGAYAPGSSLVAGSFSCVIGESCDPVVINGETRDVSLRVDRTLSYAAPLSLAGAPCQHLVTCQRMLNGQVYPMGISSLNQILSLGAPNQASANVVRTSWRKLTGMAWEIGVGANGTAWVLGTKEGGVGGYEVYRYNGADWIRMPGNASRISVDGPGNAWVTTKNREIYRWADGRFVRLPGSAQDVAVNANGQAWMVGTNRVSGGYGVFRWNGTGWSEMPGGAHSLAVDPDGNAWIVDAAKSVFRWDGSSFKSVPGQIQNLGIASNGAVYGIDARWNLVRWDGSTWAPVVGAPRAYRVAADGYGYPWVVTLDKEIYRLSQN
jgi:hypothetical protein